MSKLHPTNKTLLCKQISPSTKQVVEGGIAFQREELPMYEILEISKDIDDPRLSIGMQVISNSTPTKVTLDKSDYYLIRYEYLAAIVQ